MGSLDDDGPLADIGVNAPAHLVADADVWSAGPGVYDLLGLVDDDSEAVAPQVRADGLRGAGNHLRVETHLNSSTYGCLSRQADETPCEATPFSEALLHALGFLIHDAISPRSAAQQEASHLRRKRMLLPRGRLGRSSGLVRGP
jgi:hypothetical protein